MGYERDSEQTTGNTGLTGKDKKIECLPSSPCSPCAPWFIQEKQLRESAERDSLVTALPQASRLPPTPAAKIIKVSGACIHGLAFGPDPPPCDHFGFVTDPSSSGCGRREEGYR